MPERGTGTMMMNISQYILEMFGVKKSSLRDMAGMKINGIRVMQRYLFTLLTGYPWYSKWGYFPKDEKSKKIVDKNYEIIHNTIMTRQDLDMLKKKLQQVREDNVKWAIEPDQEECDYEYYRNTIDSIDNLLPSHDLYKLEGLPFTEFYSKLLASHPRVAIENLREIKPDGVELRFKNKYVKVH